MSLCYLPYVISNFVGCGDWTGISARDPSCDWTNLTHHQCLAFRIPDIGEPLNQASRCLKWDDFFKNWHSLVKIDSFMLTQWEFILPQAAPNVNRDMQYLSLVSFGLL